MTVRAEGREGVCNDHAKDKNLKTVVPCTIFSLYANVYKHVYGDSTKDEEEKSSTRTPFVVKQRKEMVTDLEKCCMTL